MTRRIATTRMTTKPSAEFMDTSYDLLDFNMEYARVLLPTIVYIVIMIFVGGLGNSVVLLVYYKAFKPSSTRIFILSLGVINLVACLLNFPSKIVEYCYHYTFYSPGACRSMYVMRAALVMCTGFICVAIAMDRHRRVCRQCTSQWSAKDAWKAVGVCVMLAAIISGPYAAFTGARKVSTRNSNLTGVTCGVENRHQGSTLLASYQVLLIVMFLVGLIVIVTSYVQIAHKVWKQTKRVSELNESGLKSPVVRRHISEAEVLPSELYSATEGSRAEADVTVEKCAGSQGIELSDLQERFSNVHSTDASRDVSSPNVVVTQSTSGTVDRTESMDVNIIAGRQQVHVVNAAVSPSPPGNMEQLADTGFEVPLPGSHVTGHSWLLCSARLARLQPLLRTLKCCIVESCTTSSSSSATITSSPKGRTFRAEGNARAKKMFSTTTLTLLVMTFIFLLGYVPTLTILSIQAAVGYSEDVTRPWAMNLHQLCLLSSYLCFCVSPIVHCICSVRFRRHLRKMFCSDSEEKEGCC